MVQVLAVLFLLLLSLLATLKSNFLWGPSMSIVISTFKREVLSLFLRAVFMRFCYHSTISSGNCEVSNLEVEHHFLLVILPHMRIRFQLFLFLGQWFSLFHSQNNSRFSSWTLFQRIYLMTNRAGHFGPQIKWPVNMCVFKASHSCNAVLMLPTNMVKVILTRLLVFQAIDFKTARDRFGMLFKDQNASE